MLDDMNNRNCEIVKASIERPDNRREERGRFLEDGQGHHAFMMLWGDLKLPHIRTAQAFSFIIRASRERGNVHQRVHRRSIGGNPGA